LFNFLPAATQLEFVVRRIPYGKVFALKREEEGQPLGILREGNTAEIREVGIVMVWSKRGDERERGMLRCATMRKLER
jgi:hypothetical protein